MIATTNLHNASEGRRSSTERDELAAELYAAITSGHDGLGFNVDRYGPALTVVGEKGQRHVVPGCWGGDRPAWQPARELVLVDGVRIERDRLFSPQVLAKHIGGGYSVAPGAAGWVGWVALDIDAHAAPTEPGAPELVARRLARARADRVLAGVWRALRCSAERHPLVTRSPGFGYHLWLPLTRGPSSANPEHTWPAAFARAWFERHLSAEGLELAPGVLEVYPQGRRLRAPCGPRTVLLRATRPDDPDALGLVPWEGTMADEQRVDWSGELGALSTPVRRVVPMVRAFLGQWRTQRRTIADWLGRPEAEWDPTWGFLGWRAEAAPPEISPAEKNRVEPAEGQDSRSQQSDDSPGRHRAGGSGASQEGRGGGGPRPGSGSAASSPIRKNSTPPPAADPDLPPDPAGSSLVHGRAFKRKVNKLVGEGITQPSTRHDGVLTLVFYWGATCGLLFGEVLSRLESWCRAHQHQGSRLTGREFVADCLYEGAHYYEHHSPGWRFRGRGDAGGLATLTDADQAVLAVIDPRVRDEGAVLLAWLAGRADGEGRIAEPVEIATGLLARLCTDRRIVEGGKRRRATAIAIAELERLGVLTLASEYRVGAHGRRWSCWYRFGSGVLPRTVELPAAEWARLDPARPVKPAPTLAIVPSAPREDAPSDPPVRVRVVAPTLAIVPSAPREDAPSDPPVRVRVVGERVVPEGLLRVLSDGARGRPRMLLTLAREVARPTAKPAAREPWFVRAFQGRTLTPGELAAASLATVIAFPDVEARRRMTRRQRLAWGGGTGASASGAAAPIAPVVPLATSSASSPAVAPSPSSGPPTRAEDPRLELAAEIGAKAAAEIPIDLAEVMARAWGAFRGRGS